MRCCTKTGQSALIATAVGAAVGLLTFSLSLRVTDASAPQAQTLTVATGTLRATTSGVTQSDIDAIDQAITGVYDVISGPAGEPRDWDRFRDMFAEGGELAVSAPTQQGRTIIAMSPDDYIERFGDSLVQNGFRESETHRVLEVFGSIAHAFSTYRGTLETNDEFLVQGINSIQLVRVGRADEARWKVHSILWHQMGRDETIPEKYRPAGEAEEL